MKKVLFVVVLMLVASTCFAQLQSGPSNVVGYVKITATAAPAPGLTAATPFGLAFKFWTVAAGIPNYGIASTFPSDILGDQPNPGSSSTGDLIHRQDNGHIAWRNTAGTWLGSLQTNQTMTQGRAYWYKNRQTVAKNFVLAGEVANAASYGTITVAVVGNAYTPYGWRDSRSVNRDDLNLVASGFIGGSSTTSDKVWDQNTGATFFRTTAGLWSGSLVTIEPGRGCWIQNKHAASWAGGYTYDYSGNTLAISPNPRQIDDSGVAKISTPPATKVKTGTARQ